ncbi:MAG: LacI family DNA-binding transcriptional regulator [Gilvibacter sp.]
MPKMTLKKIAKELEVSISTVSKALKDSHEIGEDTRKRIQAFAALYNYKPNNIALSLKNSKAHTIGIIIPEIVHHFFTTVIQGVEEVANKRGYNVIVGLSNESFIKEVTNMEMLANGSIDGFIVSVAKETLKLGDYHHLQETINQGMPIVMFDRDLPEIQCDKVVVDDTQGARMAVNKLASLGCKKIGIITTSDYVNVGKLRLLGYELGLKDNGILSEPSRILKLEDTLNEVSQIDQLDAKIAAFILSEDFDAVFTVNEIYALSAMKALRAKGQEIPKDVKIIGFTDGMLSKYASPSLSVVSQHGLQIGQRAANLLIDRIEQELASDSYFTEVIATTLIERGSTKV